MIVTHSPHGASAATMSRAREGGAGLSDAARAPADGKASFRLLAGRALLLAALALAIATRGAVSNVALLGTLLLAGGALLLGALGPPHEIRTRRSFRLAILLASALAVFVLLQAWSFPGNPLANPLWSYVARLVEATGGAISVDPGATRDAVFLLVSPFVFYAAALALFPRDEGALRLLGWLAAFGILFALFGLAQTAFFPHRLLFTEKTAYLDSLTSVFVNRNTAGSLLGTAALIVISLAAVAFPRGRGGWAAGRTFSRSDEGTHRALLLALAAVVIMVALLLTRSRGALLATVIALIAVLPVLILDRGRRSGSTDPAAPEGSRWRAALVFGAVALGLCLLVGLFGGLAVQRMEARGLDQARLCLYMASLDAFGQNWRFGTGFGTFASVYPIYRLPGCGAPADVILRAHNFYLEGLVGLGAGFVPVLLGGYVHVVGNLVRGFRHRRRLRAVPLLALGAVILVSLHGLVDFSLQIPGMAAYLATYLAAATTISLNRGGTRRKRMSAAWH